MDTFWWCSAILFWVFWVCALQVLFQLKDMFEGVEQLQAEIAASLPQHHRWSRRRPDEIQSGSLQMHPVGGGKADFISRMDENGTFSAAELDLMIPFVF